MKLYLAPGACSQAPHICLREAGAAFEVVKVDLRSKKFGDGQDFLEINPRGFVPVLELDDGSRLSECSAILQFLAERYPEARLGPSADGLNRFRWLEWLGHINSDLHKGMGALFRVDEASRPRAVENLTRLLGFVEKHLEGRTFLVEERFTAVDAYLFVILQWHKWVNFDLAPFANLTRFMARIADRPSVSTARAAER
jgi:glutathione S-transferase